MTVPYALSVHAFIKNVGADAGFASIIGLALLVLLYFAQMRETTTLRDRLEEADGRVSQLENRLAHVARAQTAAMAARPPQPAVAPRPIVPLRPMGSAVATLRTYPGNAVNAAVQPRPVPVLAGAPAGFGAPALGSATKLIPTPTVVEPAEGPGPVDVPAVGVPAVAALAGGQQATVGAAQTAAGGATFVAQDTVLLGSPVVETGANGHAVAAPPVVAPPPTGGGTGVLRDPALSEFDVPLDPGGAGGAGAPPRVHIGRGSRGGGTPRRAAAGPGSPGGSSLARRLVLALVGLALVAALVVVLLSVTGGATQKTSLRAGRGAHKPAKKHHPTAPVFNPATVTVAVLNGTAVYHLAQDVATKLNGRGYKQGPVTNASTQTQASTVVGYLAGHEVAADEVAAALRLSSTAVQQAGQSAIVACADFAAGGATTTSSSCPADVIVTVGADLTKDGTGTSTE